MKTTTIVAAVNQFPQDDAVLLRGHEIATRHGVPLNIVHIVELPGHAGSAVAINTFRGQARLAASDRIESALRRLCIDPASVEVHIDTGIPAQRLVEICGDLEAALVVMRAHQKAGLVKKLLGSTTEKTISSGQFPVLVVQPTVVKPYERVLLAVDGPDSAPIALAFVLSLLPDAQAHMVQAIAVQPQLEQAMLRVGLAQADLKAHHETLAKTAESRLETLVAELGPHVSCQVLRGDPAEQLARATHDPAVDLIALGPNRSGLVRRVFIGSVTRRLLRDAACDVLIGCPPDAGRSDLASQGDHTTAGSADTIDSIAV